ncbi:hypothetical protein B0T21DRAFT_361373 [Apiosordaria backusii]|uniref:Uncharacterized protein n=1 Tax=Apiosordaria backusii TaxID=314023 RepID=A0AA40K1J6_9PEZI|nr:hypothetical protein B0T21DRAFT_361373 [Apiosordaria backusii]
MATLVHLTAGTVKDSNVKILTYMDLIPPHHHHHRPGLFTPPPLQIYNHHTTHVQLIHTCISRFRNRARATKHPQYIYYQLPIPDSSTFSSLFLLLLHTLPLACCLWEIKNWKRKWFVVVVVV